MKILVIGAAGFTGGYVYRLGSKKHEMSGTSMAGEEGFEKLDLSTGEGREVLEKACPDAIVLAAGVTNMDYCEEKPEETWKANVGGTQIVADYCKKSGCKLVFYSSDAVFDGATGPHSEGEPYEPKSEYARQKVEAEKIISKLDNHLIMRTSSVYGWDPRRTNFVARLYDALKAGKEFKAPSDQSYTPTYVFDLAGATLKLVEKGAKGAIHAAGPDFISRLDFAKAAAEELGLDSSLIKEVKTEDLAQKAYRPSKGGLKCAKLASFGVKMRGIRECLSDMRETQETVFKQFSARALE